MTLPINDVRMSDGDGLVAGAERAAQGAADQLPGRGLGGGAGFLICARV